MQWLHKQQQVNNSVSFLSAKKRYQEFKMISIKKVVKKELYGDYSNSSIIKITISIMKIPTVSNLGVTNA